MNDEYYMEFALSLGKKIVGQTSPNPPVGAVVVNNGQIVGFGAHLKAGGPHAEVHALNMAGEKAKGSTVYVTLEPCSHHGRTPPCADLLINKEVSRVVIATTDPFEKVAGNGIKRLQEAGLEVEVGVLKEKADEVNEQFFHYIKTKKPYVTLKSATSLDGKIATASGESKWITSEEARLDAHKYRHSHDAILVGVNTVLKDDPSLTTRLPVEGKNPIRIILDTNLRTPLHAKVMTQNDANTWIVVGKSVRREEKEAYLNYNHVEIIQLTNETINISELLHVLAEKSIMSVFVEGGAEVNGSFLKVGAVNQVITYMAPKLIGGKNAPTAIGGAGIDSLEVALPLQIISIEKIGPDIKIISRVEDDT
ncbi:diaminohydroxyphosphoribosylaminopyrimidine deaminase/5-amino-6-(5-phosphoribosylamino)uracil reductase [Salirhabdus euzebyi]|uniref:Riboflavin biosynthesis protein RibD n=1 Tax=Salirhabdus euzebyi TaxID=394506 RepID=A0A841Q6V3_9BACI|nr:bifunctional diaminohydroxyphosphoribosylaminopyrimidine deaminase/5-amino-6-(5-phosphoribosylamino)uracil reductase RibD [Salirhabdus euzebyi]MBB6454083.1 diaminohydroxyphosphoribosylaminopyrimidine deaminase/5-amino-6-(5-phosphoribosylamino)uracil reductase [Salirhabdus euzebyi]